MNLGVSLLPQSQVLRNLDLSHHGQQLFQHFPGSILKGCVRGGDCSSAMTGTVVTASGLPQIRTLGYGCQLIGGVLVEQCPSRSEVGRRLLVVSAQFSHCRTVLRLFDDLAMFVYTKQYGLANAVHWLSPGVLWAGRFPPWLVGLMGTISSILSMYQAARVGKQAEADSP